MSPKELIGTIEYVEFHSQDPTAEDRPDPWDAVQAELGSLRERLKETYRKVADDSGPTEEEIKQAFATLLDAWDQMAAAVTTALNDPKTRGHLKQAVSSFSTALGETISGLGDELKSSDADWSRFRDESGDQQRNDANHSKEP